MIIQINIHSWITTLSSCYFSLVS